MKVQPTLKSLSIFFVSILFINSAFSQTKKVKRPKSKVGISSVDRFVQESFDIYDKVYKYDEYAANQTPLTEDDIDVLEEAVSEVTVLTESAPDIAGDIKGAGIFKQGKATLQLNKAKKVLKYSAKTAKELLLGQREHEKKEDDKDSENNEETSDEKDTETSNSSKAETDKISNTTPLEVYSKFDFVPGDKILFFDDFSQDFVGDFPAQWNTNGNGEVVRTNLAEGNWFQMFPDNTVTYIPNIENLPEDYTIEFDVLTSNTKEATISGIRMLISESDNFKDNNNNQINTLIPIGNGSFHCKNTFNGRQGKIDSKIEADLYKTFQKPVHVSIAVNKNRFRVWVNEKKHIDIPKYIEKLNVLKYIKFKAYYLNNGKANLFIKNLKVAEGGLDLRRELIAKGRISTNAILFDSGSATIQPQSLGVIRQISQVLIQDENMKLNIIGHTDSDGTDASNLTLSKGRAEAVKQVLIDIYKVDSNRLTIDGKGESEPVADNGTSDGKAQNRRVEFVKIN